MSDQYPNESDDARENGVDPTTSTPADANTPDATANSAANGNETSQPTGAGEPSYPSQDNTAQYGQYQNDTQNSSSAQYDQYAQMPYQYQGQYQTGYESGQQSPYVDANAGQSRQNPYADPNAGQYQTGQQNPYGDTNTGQYQQQYAQQYQYQQYSPVPAGYIPRNKYVAAALGIMFGCLGLHNFYLGYTGKAVAQILITVLGALLVVGPIASAIWGLVEGMLILCSDRGTKWHQDAKGVELEH